MMKFTRTLYHSLPFALCACMAFGFTACSNDEVPPQQNTTVEDEVLDDMLYSDGSLIDYVMSQFAELNADGSLSKRTTYFRHLDESDSTAIYTLTATVADARRKFLSLVPESYQKKIIVKNDSAEMSLPMGTSPLMLKYKEGSTDGNVLATVQLPSQGAYTKIANTLTMVKSFGENVVYDPNQYLCRFKQIERNVLVSKSPLPIDSLTNPLKEKLFIEKHKLNMLCYHVDAEGKAYYAFIPPLVTGDSQLQYKDTGHYLVGHLYPYWFKTSFIEGKKEYDLIELRELLKEVLPSPSNVKKFTEGIKGFWNDHSYEGGLNKDNLKVNYSNWFDANLFTRLESATTPTKKERETYNYLKRVNTLFNSGAILNVDILYDLSACYPYTVGDYANYLNPPQIPEYVSENKDKGLPFFIKEEDWMRFEGNYEKLDLAKKRACTYATNLIYTRGKDGVANVVASYGDWEVVDFVPYCYFFKPVLNMNDGEWTFKPQGRLINCSEVYPFRIVYLYEEEMEPLPDEE